MNDPRDLVALIGRLETLSRSSPATYRFRVAAIAALGYVYLIGIIAGLLAFVYLAIWAMIFLHQLNYFLLKLLWVPLVLAWLVLKSMWVSVPSPEGQELQRKEAPALFELIREIRTNLNSPRVHHVLLTGEFNAAIVRVPRLGMFGWNRNYLVLGMPLAKSLSPEEFRAVLAHEFGHLSGKHSRFSGWVYYARQSWIQIMARVQLEKHYASFLFERFFAWYAPYFNAYSFVLARAQEYEADSYSVELSGRDTAAQALIQLELRSHCLTDDFWPVLFQDAKQLPDPPANPFSLMLEAVQNPIAEPRAEKLFHRALKVKTDYDNTHPALAERLSGLGVDASSAAGRSMLLQPVISKPEQNALQRYLEPAALDAIASFDRILSERIGLDWRHRYAEIQELQARLVELEQKLQSEPLTAEEQWERVRCVGETQNSKATLPLLQEVVNQQPDHVKGNWILGTLCWNRMIRRVSNISNGRCAWIPRPRTPAVI